MSWRIIAAMALVVFVTDYALSQDSSLRLNEQPITVQQKLNQLHIELTEGALVAALRDSSAEVRSLAAIQLADTKVRSAIPDIISAVNKETSLLTKANTASTLIVLGDETGFSVLKKMCNSADIPGGFRTLAAGYLLDVNDGSCFDAVLSVLETDEAPSSQMTALELLPRFKNVSESDFRKMYALDVKGLTNPDPTVRLYASNTLVALGGDSAIGYLQGAIAAETDEGVRTQMEANLRRLQEKKNP